VSLVHGLLSGGLKVQISDIVVLGMPSGDEIHGRLDDRSVASDKPLLGVIVTGAAEVVGRMLPLVNQSWLKFTLSWGEYFHVSPRIVALNKVMVLSYLYK